MRAGRRGLRRRDIPARALLGRLPARAPLARAPVPRPPLVRPPVPRALLAGALIVGALPAGALSGCGGETGADRAAADPDATAERALPPSPGTRRMAARLAALEDPMEISRLVRELDAVPRPGDLRGHLMYGARRADLLMRSGRIDEALTELAEAERVIAEYAQRVPRPFKLDVSELAAAAGLWGVVQRGCMARTEACLFPLPARVGGGPAPLDPPAVERLRDATSRLEAVLEERPDDRLSRWLLNLGWMTLGGYPDSVPARWRIPRGAFAPEEDVGRFPEIGAALGVDVAGLAGGAVMDDLDGDGDLDLLASSQSLGDTIRFFRNDDGRFVDATREAGLAGLVGGLNLVHADYDDDGDLDVLALRGGWLPSGQPNSLLRNRGDGTFEDVTEEAGLLSSRPTQTAAWADYDGDGDLDLFIGNESETRGRRPRIHPSELYRNEGDGTFTEVAEQAGLAVVAFVKAAVWGDYDDDGLPDLYLSCFDEPNLLFRNEGPGPEGGWRFTEVAAAAGVAEPRESFPAWWWDYDNDGRLDLFVSGYRLHPGDVAAEYLGHPGEGALPRLYRNRGDGTFEDVTREAGLERVLYTMGSNFGDLDNDGWLDFYAGTGEPNLRALVPNRMLRNVEGRRFVDVTASGGFGHVGKGHGVAFGDLDGDGDQDLYAVIGGAVEADVGRNVLFENPGHGNRWVTLRLEGVEANRSAIGARISLLVETKAGGERRVRATVGSGGSFGASSLQQEIGLGRARAIRELEVRWPGSGRVDRFPDVPLDRVLRVREGATALEEVETTIRRLGDAGGG